MKPYILRFTNDDFTFKSGNVWRTDIIDLYVNNQYTNYSVKRSPYGSDILDNGIYTGAATPSEIGYTVGGRFVDLSGRIDIIAWTLDLVNTATATGTVYYTLGVFHSPDASSTTANPTDWAFREGLTDADDIYVIGSNRYAYFELTFETEVDVNDYEVSLNVSVDIEPPHVKAFFPQTGALLNQFPQWMEINERSPSDPNYLDTATPTSLGGQVLNAVAGEWLTDIQSKFNYQQAQSFIDTVDLGQKAWVYRASGVPNVITSIKGDGTELARTSTIEEFHQSQPEDHACFWNRSTREIYVNNEYTTFLINGEAADLMPYQVWNSVDDIGITVDLFRHELESNDSFRKRIIDVYRNKPGTSKEAFKNALRRELNLWSLEGATPDSDYSGATPTVYELADLETNPEYFTPEGLPTDKFKALVDRLAKKYPLTWGYFTTGKAFWDPNGVGREGFGYIPRLYDATPATIAQSDSGVGDGNDLYLFRPDATTDIVEFTTKLRVKGRQRTNRLEYLPLEFDVQVYGQGDRARYNNPVFEGEFTIELTLDDATVWFANVSAVATSDVGIGQALPSPQSRAMIEWTTPTGFTDASVAFYRKTTGARYSSGGATPSELIDLSLVDSVVIRPGSFNPTSQTQVNVPTAADYKAWYDGTPNTWIGAGGVATLTATPFDWPTRTGTFFVESQLTSNSVVVDSYQTPRQTFTINLNTNNPPTTAKNYTLTIPPLAFPADVTNREIIVELATYSGPIAGAFATEQSATPIFLDYSYLQIAGNNTWISNRYKTFATNTTTVTFSSRADAAYPTNIPDWTPFEAVQTVAVSGTVDRNGPWRDGVRLPDSNTNNLLVYLNNLNRASFGIPNTTDYIITWIGIDTVSSPQVTAWVESNTVKPAVAYEGESNLNMTYPDNAVVETFSGGVYSFSAVPLYAKLKPGSNEKWLPKIHSGWMYDSQEEYYLYANPGTATGTTSSIALPMLNRQGAPLTVAGIASATPRYELRQVSNFIMDDTATPATPQYSLNRTETVKGNGTNKLYVGYKDIYNIAVRDATIDAVVTTTSATSTTNTVTLTANSKVDHDYEITYRIRKSYYVNNEYFNGTDYVTQVVFNDTAAGSGYTSYSVVYEKAIYDPATPIDIPLNAMYTPIDEGFIYVDHEIHALDRVEIAFSPSRLLASTTDYGMITVRTYDDNGNPKPKQVVTLSTNFGTIDKTTVTTDNFGFGYATLTGEAWDGTLTPSPAISPATPPTQANSYLGVVKGTTGGKESRAFFQIDIPRALGNRIFAVPRADSILADAHSTNAIVGRLETSAHVPVNAATVTWRKGRSVHAVLTAAAGTTTGTVVTDVNGRFLIEPFVSSKQPGYWFVSVTTGTVGDIVSWYEYPNVNAAIDPITNLPIANNQDATPVTAAPNYTYGSVFPVTMDEANPMDVSNNATPQWIPPSWYPINRYRQYQMGLYGSGYYAPGATPSNPDYTEL